MTNEEARNKLRVLVAELESLDDSEFNAKNKSNITKAVDLLKDVSVWNFED